MIKARKDPPVSVDLARIDDDPGPFCMSFAFDLGMLLSSIKKFGLINPPFVARKTEGGGLEVVAGYRRILALKALNCKKVLCMDLSESVRSPLERLLLNLYDNLATRKFNDVEKAMVLSRLSLLVSRKEILQGYMPLLDLPSHEPTLEVYLHIQDLEHEIREAFARKLLSLQTVTAVMELDSLSQRQLFRWISKLKFNVNQQRQFIDMIIDLSSKSGIGLSDFLAERELVQYLEEPISNRPLRAKEVLQSLRELRYPRLARAERIFREKVSSLSLPEGIRVRVPPYFESPDYCLEISFRDGRSLKQKIEDLSKIRGIERLRDPWAEEE